MPNSQKTGVFLSHEIAAIIGDHSITGWSDGVIITPRQLTPNVADKEGAGGEQGIVISNSAKFEIDINVLQTSNDNYILSLLHQASIKAGTTYPFRLEDPSGKTLGLSPAALFRQFPDASINKDDVETYTWVLFAAHFEYIIGGNVS
jgi:hypothetical protein